MLANPTKSTAHESIMSHVGCTIISVRSRALDKNRLKAHPVPADLLDSFLAHTGLTLEPNST